jgi:hypothetical protein
MSKVRTAVSSRRIRTRAKEVRHLESARLGPSGLHLEMAASREITFFCLEFVLCCGKQLEAAATTGSTEAYGQNMASTGVCRGCTRGKSLLHKPSPHNGLW